MTDGKMVATMARIQRLTDCVNGLIEGLLDHPNGEALTDDVHVNGLGYSWDCALMAQTHLLHPERWEYATGQLNWKGGE